MLLVNRARAHLLLLFSREVAKIEYVHGHRTGSNNSRAQKHLRENKQTRITHILTATKNKSCTLVSRCVPVLYSTLLYCIPGTRYQVSGIRYQVSDMDIYVAVVVNGVEKNTHTASMHPLCSIILPHPRQRQAPLALVATMDTFIH